IDTFNGKKAGIDAALAAAVAAAPAISRTFYIDQVAGDDAAAGTQIAPLKTLAQAIANTPSGGTLEAVLLTDYTHEVIVHVNNRRVMVRGDSSASNTRKLILKDFASISEVGKKSMGAFQMSRACGLDFADLTLSLPDNAALNLPLANYYALTYAGGNAMPAHAAVKLYNCVFELRGTFVGKICGPSWGTLSLAAINTSIPAALEGSIVHSVPALKDPNTIPWLLIV
ncbi:hypothetical protein BC89_33555, partial [Pseudomonas monteilii]